MYPPLEIAEVPGESFAALLEHAGFICVNALFSVSMTATPHASEGFTLRLDVPGYDKASLRVKIAEDDLSIQGDQPVKRSRPGESIVQSERHSSSVSFVKLHFIECSPVLILQFERFVAIPRSVERAGITAKYEHGVLEIWLPKVEEAEKVVHFIHIM